MRELSESLEVTRILVHRDVDNAIQDRDDLVFTFEAFFEFNVFVPEGVSEEVEANAVGTTLKEPARECQQGFERQQGRESARMKGQDEQIRQNISSSGLIMSNIDSCPTNTPR